MVAIRKRELHAKILAATGRDLEASGSPDEVPYRLRVDKLGAFAFYAFTLTSPPGGRPIGEYKVQLIVPWQRRGTRGHLRFTPGAFTVIVGWSQEEGGFALWDAYAHEAFSYSQNLQVKGDCVWLARAEGLSTCERRLRGGRGTETTVVCRHDRFMDALRARVELSASRLGNVGAGS